jgi:tetratricopeptide (TPR) repeat protein
MTGDGDGDGIRSRLPGGRARSADQRLTEALDSRLGESERVVSRLAGGGLAHEDGDRTRRLGGETILAATDRRLVFAAAAGGSPETVTAQYTDLRSVRVDAGLLRTGLTVAVWGRGTLRFRPSEAAAARDLAAFATDASEAWQRAVAALQEAEEHAADLAARIEAGRIDAAGDARDAAREQLRTARRQADAAPDPAADAIEDRVASAEREFARTRMRARYERGRALADEVGVLTATADYDAAYATAERAGDHLDTARSIATDRGFEASSIRSERGTLDERLETLRGRPLDRAERALTRVHGSTGDHATVTALEHAFECYRDALTAGWGTGARFAGDTDALRLQIEWLAAAVIRHHRRLAARYESEGDIFRTRDAESVALDRYETAAAHLRAADRLASQYLAGDAVAIRDRLAWVVTKLSF